ncbi:MAG: MspA family porin, partial [Segniliparus sp.]
MGSGKQARRARRALAGLTAGVSVWGALLSSSGVAFADTTVDLPDDSLTQTLPDGTAVTLSVRDQYAIVSPAMVAVQT